MNSSRLWVGVVSTAITMVASFTLAGCGSDEEKSSQEPQSVVAGIVRDGDGGAPLSGVAVELLVWPSPQAGGAAEVGEAPQLLQLDEATTASDGTFALEALAKELSPHASSDGQVGLEIREVGASGAGMRTTVRLSRGQGDGEFTVHTIEDLELTPAALGQG